MLDIKILNEIERRAARKAIDVDRENGIPDLLNEVTVKNDILFGLKNEFGDLGLLEENELADIYEFIDRYELPYRLQKEFGLIRSRPGTVIERVTKVNEKYKYYGFRINHNTLLCESREELIGILNESGLGNRIYIGTEYDYSKNGDKIIFIGMAKEQSNEIS